MALHEIDLIPLDYRTQLTRLNIVRQFSIFSMALLLLAISSYAVLNYLTSQLKSDTALLQKNHTITMQHRSDLAKTQQKQQTLQKQWSSLQRLRSGAAVEVMLESIDAALPDNVWFLSWKFQRIGVIEIKPETIKHDTGYFIVTPQDGAAEKPTGTLLQTNMTIIGQANDHAVLSDFVQRLFKQPEIQNVRIVKTSIRRYSTANVIDFELSVIVNTKLREN